MNSDRNNQTVHLLCYYVNVYNDSIFDKGSINVGTASVDLSLLIIAKEQIKNKIQMFECKY